MKIKKVLIVALLVILVTISIMPTVNATINPDNYKPNDLNYQQDTMIAFKKARNIMTAITTTGVVVSIVTVMVLGIKYMIGSVEERAEYKKTMIPILVGMIMLFCTSTIVSIIYRITTENLN